MPIAARKITSVSECEQLDGRNYSQEHSMPMVVTKANFNHSGSNSEPVQAPAPADKQSTIEAAHASSSVVVLRNIFDVQTAKTKAGYLEVCCGLVNHIEL